MSCHFVHHSLLQKHFCIQCIKRERERESESESLTDSFKQHNIQEYPEEQEGDKEEEVILHKNLKTNRKRC